MALAAAAAISTTNAVGPALAASGNHGHPVVVELFTSQGCYSCPPADKYLGELKKRDDVIALAFHIDYWDYIGWKDPFASPASTDRQRRYGKALGLWSIYTPQMVIDGRLEGVGSRTGEIADKIARVGAMSPADRVTIPLSAQRSGNRVSVKIEGGAAPREGDIWMVAYDDSHTTEVRRGENAGKSLEEYNIVRGIRRVGEWTGESISADYDVAEWLGAADNVAILLQEKGQGAIYGAATVKIR